MGSLVELWDVCKRYRMGEVSRCAAFTMTILFMLLVDWIMYFRLKKISMVESMKSVE